MKNDNDKNYDKTNYDNNNNANNETQNDSNDTIITKNPKISKIVEHVKSLCFYQISYPLNRKVLLRHISVATITMFQVQV